MKVKFKKLHPDAVIPTYAHPGDAGLDLTATDRKLDPETGCLVYSTGLAIEVPEGFVGLIFPRSSIYKKGQHLTNHVGVIDHGYVGEIRFMFRCSSNGPNNFYKVGDRIGQLIIIPFPKIEVEEVAELSSTERGEGGFGSTGR